MSALGLCHGPPQTCEWVEDGLHIECSVKKPSTSQEETPARDEEQITCSDSLARREPLPDTEAMTLSGQSYFGPGLLWTCGPDPVLLSVITFFSITIVIVIELGAQNLFFPIFRNDLSHHVLVVACFSIVFPPFFFFSSFFFHFFFFSSSSSWFLHFFYPPSPGPPSAGPLLPQTAQNFALLFPFSRHNFLPLFSVFS